MAKKKNAKKEESANRTETSASITADQYFEEARNRPIIPISLSLDIALGGGFPMVGAIIISGMPKVGKTTLICQAIANAQALYGKDIKIFYMNIEGRLNLGKVFAQARGLQFAKNDNFRIICAPKYHENGRQIGSMKPTTEWWLARTEEVILEHPGAIIIWDSFAALCGESEYSSEIGHEDRGKSYKVVAQFCRKYGDTITSNGITFFVLTQMTANTSGYGKAYVAKAATALKHLCDTHIFLKGGTAISIDKQKIGVEVEVIVEESAFGAPFIPCNIPLVYGKGFDVFRDLKNQAVNWGLIKQNGAWFIINKGEEEIKIQGEEGVIQMLGEKPDIGASIDFELRKILLPDVDAKKNMGYCWPQEIVKRL
ncbi:MAG: hypothetical protein WC967_12085 [Balneolaceae bacterium]